MGAFMQKGNSSMTKTVPVQLSGGIIARIDPAQISSDNWIHHHGKTATGKTVNSLKTATIGDSILLRKSTGGPTFSTPAADFEVAAVQILDGMGYKIQAPMGQ